MKWPDKYVVYDFETTSLNTNRCEIIEIAAKVVDNGRVHRQQWLIKPTKPISRRIQKLTGITQDYLEAKGVDYKDAFTEFSTLAPGYPLIGHNIIPYDNLILKRYCENIHGNSDFMGNLRDCIDTAALFKGRLMKDEQQWHEGHYEWAERILKTKRKGLKYNLAYACTYMHIDTGTLHRAMDDVELTHKLYLKLTNARPR